MVETVDPYPWRSRPVTKGHKRPADGVPCISIIGEHFHQAIYCFKTEDDLIKFERKQ